MSRFTDGAPGDLTPVKVNCPNDHWENTIREYGVIAACEWFGHEPGSVFTFETIALLRKRSEECQAII
jgi:hypothetical protein